MNLLVLQNNTMAQTRLIIDTLKHELRRQGINYKQVAQKLELSEASVKRLFSDHTFTLDRISKICELLNFEIANVIHEMEKKVELTQQLTLEQETELTSDMKLLLMAHFLMNKLTFEQIISIYDISESEGIRMLAKLDRMKLIELLPGNRIKLIVAKDFSFIPGGPIQRFYEKIVQQEFFDAPFDGNSEFRIFVSGFFSRPANAEIIRKIKRLAMDAHQLSEDSNEPPLEQRFGCSFIMAIRPWEVNVFDELRRVPNLNKF